ncbi:UNVERIFIED_ORG: hypothetical protein M2328_003464 [Rhodococcus erythropolis]
MRHQSRITCSITTQSTQYTYWGYRVGLASTSHVREVVDEEEQ